MNFGHPWWLLAGALGCGALFAVWRRYDARQRSALELLVAPQLRAQLTSSISSSRRLAKRVLFAAAIALVFAALAAPQAGFRWEQIKRRGNDIVFAIDTSRSMDTPDVKPTRLARAKLAVGDFVDHLNGDAVGLVAFAGSAFLQTPITLDYGAFHESLNALDTHIIPRGGTDIASAIRETQAALHNRPGSDKILILVTDGEDLEGDALAAAKAAAQQDGLKIFTVGVGTTTGDLIPLPADQGGGFLKDATGHLVKSHLDETALKALAAATGGSYAPLGAANQGLEAIYQQALAPLAKHDLEAREHKVYTQRYQWPLGAALALLFASLMVGTRRRSPALTTSLPLRRFGVATAATLVAAGLLPIHSAHASPANAAKAYREGNFAAAAQDFAKAAQQNPQQPKLQFNAGAAAYKAGEYPQAAQAFEASVNVAKSGDSKRLAEQEDAYYNLGNTQYREGQKTQQADRPATIATWTQAVKSYTAALQLRADDADSRFNRDLVQHKLDELKKQPPPKDQPKQNPPKQDQSKQDQSKQNESKPPQSGQGQPKPDQGRPDKPEQQAGNKPSEAKAQQQPGQQPSAQQQPGQSSSSAQAKPPVQPEQGQQQPTPGAANPNGSPRDGTANAQMAQSGDDQRQPGEMSRAEARQLLDSVKGDQRRMPTAPLARNGSDERASNEPEKDW